MFILTVTVVDFHEVISTARARGTGRPELFFLTGMADSGERKVNGLGFKLRGKVGSEFVSLELFFSVWFVWNLGSPVEDCNGLRVSNATNKNRV